MMTTMGIIQTTYYTTMRTVSGYSRTNGNTNHTVLNDCTIITITYKTC